MYLSEYQKELVRKLNKEGQNAIFQELEDFLVSHEICFTWNNQTYNSNIPSEYRNYFIFTFKASNPQSYVEVKSSFETRSIMNPQSQLVASVYDTGTDLKSEYRRLDKKEFRDQEELLYDFQGKLEAALHLIRILQENNLVISYENDIEESFKFGEQLEESDNERVVTWKLFNLVNCLQNRLADSLEKFLRTQIIPLPGLKKFESDKFHTPQETDRQSELIQLKRQTWYVLGGILVSAVITLIPMLRECHLAGHERIEIEYPGELLILQTDEKQFQVGAN